MQIIICLCQAEVTEKELRWAHAHHQPLLDIGLITDDDHAHSLLSRPLLEFLACFTEREVDLAEEVLQVLLYWLQQPPEAPPPTGLLHAIRSIFLSRSVHPSAPPHSQHG